MTPRRASRTVAVTVLLVVLLAACGGGGGNKGGGEAKGGDAGAGSGTKTDKVMVKDFAFSPKSITVTAGTTVTWTFLDDAEHTVASSSGESEIPESPKLKGGKTYTHTFDKPGTYPYLCTIHNSMTGTVVVTAA